MKKSDKVFFQTVIVLAVFLWLLVLDYNFLAASVIVGIGSMSGACLVTNFYELIESKERK